MHHQLSPSSHRAICDSTPKLRQSLRSRADWTIRFVLAPLPGNQVIGAAAVRTTQTFWVIVDLDKPQAREHLLDLVEHWPLSYATDLLPTVFFEAGILAGRTSR